MKSRKWWTEDMVYKNLLAEDKRITRHCWRNYSPKVKRPKFEKDWGAGGTSHSLAFKAQKHGFKNIPKKALQVSCTLV